MVGIFVSDKMSKTGLCQEKSALGNVRISCYLATAQVKVTCINLNPDTHQKKLRLPAESWKMGKSQYEPLNSTSTSLRLSNSLKPIPTYGLDQ